MKAGYFDDSATGITVHPADDAMWTAAPAKWFRRAGREPDCLAVGGGCRGGRLELAGTAGCLLARAALVGRRLRPWLLRTPWMSGTDPARPNSRIRAGGTASTITADQGPCR